MSLCLKYYMEQMLVYQFEKGLTLLIKGIGFKAGSLLASRGLRFRRSSPGQGSRGAFSGFHSPLSNMGALSWRSFGTRVRA
jgi:hypothetical protein